MSVSISDFWRLLAESHLLTAPQVQQLAGEFAGSQPPSEQANAKAAAQWLLTRKVLSRYQAMVLLKGRAGPFFYGDYKVYDRIEQGRLAGQFRAIHMPAKHLTLLRFLTGPVLSQPSLWAAAEANVAVACSIISPHVQRYFEAVDLQQFKLVVSEELRGGTAEEPLAKGRLPSAEACRIARQAALGLAEMHARRRVHGDVRPGNLFLESAAKQPANVKLLFDATQTTGTIDIADQRADAPAVLMADYLAPELATPGRMPDPLTDIYALGCTLYQLLAGQPPFAGGNLQQKLARHASEPIKPLGSLGVPQPMAQVVSFLMAKNPTVRYQSALLAAEQLAMFVEPAALKATSPSPAKTLAEYEQFLQKKRAAIAAAAPTASSDQPWFPGQRPSPDVASPIPQSTPPDSPWFAARPTATATVASVAPEIGIQIQTAARKSRSADEILRRKKAQRKRNMLVGLTLTAILLLGASVGLAVWWNSQKAAGQVAATGKTSPNKTTVSSTSGKSPSVTPASASNKSADSGESSARGEGSGSSQPIAKITVGTTGAAAQQVVADDGKLLWASPTSGKPISFRCVPPEGQVFLFLRPASLLAAPEGERVLNALGPTFAAQRQALESACGFKLDEIEQLHVTLHNNDAKFPRTSFVVKTKEAMTPEQLLSKWGNPTAVKEKDQTYYTGSTWAYYIPKSPEDERTFAMGEARDIKEVAAAAGAPPPVFREVERLRRTSDSDRHFTVLLYPQFLFNDDGEPLFAGERAKVRQPLSWLLGDQLQAASVSMHLGDDFYFELRMLGSLEKEPHLLAQELRDRLAQVPTGLEDYFVSLNPPLYWRRLALRFPIMVREVYEQARVGVENEQAIVNCMLPPTALHNLTLGGELLVSTTPGQAVVSTGNAPAAAGPKTIADALQMKTSYTFDNQSLEFAMRDLAEDVKSTLKNAPLEFNIKIIGADLEKEGITRNQSVRDFKQENQSVADILTALVRKANPITTVQDPSEINQKLVWVVGPDPDNPSKQSVLITTRTAATTKKYTLPAVFVAKK